MVETFAINRTICLQKFRFVRWNPEILELSIIFLVRYSPGFEKSFSPTIGIDLFTLSQ